MAYHSPVGWNAANASKRGVIETAMISRSLAALAVFFLASAAAHAGPQDDLIAAIGKCASLTDGTARLTCYDQVAAQAKTLAAAPTQPVAAQPAAPPMQAAAQTPPVSQKDESWFGLGSLFGGDSRPPAQQTTPQQFGSEALAPPPAAPGQATPEPLDSITATVSDFAYNPYGRFTVFLENGQIWQQNQGDTDQAHFNKNSKDQVTISRGFIGSYNLVIAGHKGLYKVKRIK